MIYWHQQGGEKRAYHMLAMFDVNNNASTCFKFQNSWFKHSRLTFNLQLVEYEIFLAGRGWAESRMTIWWRTKHGSIKFKFVQIINIFYMAFSFLKCICCCFWQKETEADPVYDETTRLIPEEPAIDVYALPNIYAFDRNWRRAMVLRSTVHQRFYERLSQIVRAKEECGLALIYFIPTLLTELLFD